MIFLSLTNESVDRHTFLHEDKVGTFDTAQSLEWLRAAVRSIWYSDENTGSKAGRAFVGSGREWWPVLPGVKTCIPPQLISKSASGMFDDSSDEEKHSSTFELAVLN